MSGPTSAGAVHLTCPSCGSYPDVPGHQPWCTARPAPSPAAAGLPLEDVERVANLLAVHDDYRVNEDGWTVCLCGHVAEGDDDDGSHARHLADVLAAAALAEMRPTAAGPDPRFRDQLAEVRADLIGDLPGAYPWHEIVDPWLAPDGPIDRLINAQVRARVQASPAPVPPDANGGEER